jgi:hypothetical protein
MMALPEGQTKSRYRVRPPPAEALILGSRSLPFLFRVLLQEGHTVQIWTSRSPVGAAQATGILARRGYLRSTPRTGNCFPRRGMLIENQQIRGRPAFSVILIQSRTDGFGVRFSSWAISAAVFPASSISRSLHSRQKSRAAREGQAISSQHEVRLDFDSAVLRAFSLRFGWGARRVSSGSRRASGAASWAAAESTNLGRVRRDEAVATSRHRRFWPRGCQGHR